MHAQVTIGSVAAPVTGALLDLKEEGTTTKGLRLPRVKLTKLNPATPDDLAKSIGATGNWQLVDHIGLIVYNTNDDKCTQPEPIAKGLYVWNGSQWQALNEEVLAVGVGKITDDRPQVLGNQTYLYANFGDAGDWMLENMRYIPPANAAVQLTAKAGGGRAKDKYYSYPQGNPNATNATIAIPDANAGIPPSTWFPSQGLLYSYSAATLGVQDNVSTKQGQGDAGEATQPAIQGICPPKWHIPSDTEWNQLEEVIYNNAGSYSTYTPDELSNINLWNPASAPNAWKSSWNTMTDWRGSSKSGGHGAAMKSPCPLPNSTTATDGKSFYAAQGGFNGSLTGYIFGGSARSYGLYGYFWSGSINGTSAAWFRDIDNDKSQVWRNSINRGYLFSVRCKKDN